MRVAPDQQAAHTPALRRDGDHADDVALGPCRSRQVADGGLAAEEALVRAAPEVMVTTTQGIEASGGLEKFWSRPGLELTPAYRQRSLVALDALYLIGFGPRLPQAVAELHRFSLKVAA